MFSEIKIFGQCQKYFVYVFWCFSLNMVNTKYMVGYLYDFLKSNELNCYKYYWIIHYFFELLAKHILWLLVYYSCFLRNILLAMIYGWFCSRISSMTAIVKVYKSDASRAMFKSLYWNFTRTSNCKDIKR